LHPPYLPSTRTEWKKAFIIITLVALGISLLIRPHPAIAQPSAWPSISLVRIANNHQFVSPVDLENANDNSGRVFVVSQNGIIHVIKAGSVLSTPFLDITDRVAVASERGLLGLAFPPQYTSKGYFYVYYTRLDGNNQVSRFYITSNPDVADPSSEEQILTLPHPNYANHNGGKLAFGPDGYLYLGPGDGGGGGDPNGNAQNTNSLLGKLLRIDVEPHHAGPAAGAKKYYFPLISRNLDMTIAVKPYQIPPNNPFVGQPNHRQEIWATGLRNPWRFSFDSQTGDLYIGDVGQNRMEEVDFQPASSKGGENYGWNILEGTLCYPNGPCTPPANYSPPVTTYEHGVNDTTGCAVTGGYVYRGSTYPSMQAIYFYADYCSGKIWGLQKDNSGWHSQELLDTNYNFSSFGVDQAGELYITDLNGGIYHITTP
jgi:glucose/arabinose dehydrogenase